MRFFGGPAIAGYLKDLPGDGDGDGRGRLARDLGQSDRAGEP